MTQTDALANVLENKPTSPAVAFSALLQKQKAQIALALPKHLTADRMCRLALTAFSSSRQLQACDPKSIISSIMLASQLGLEPGVNGQGYLIPYKTTCQFVPGWKGLVDLVSRSGRAVVWSGVVRSGDFFEYELGSAPFIKHKPEGDDADGDFTHVYACGKVKDSEMPVIEVWTKARVLKHLAKFNKQGDRHYALADGKKNFEQYAKKVVLLQVLKYMPQSIEIANALAASTAAELGVPPVIDGDFVTLDIDPETGEIKQ